MNPLNCEQTYILNEGMTDTVAIAISVMLPINWKNFQAFWAHGLCISIAGLYQPSSELNIFDGEKFQSSQHKETALGHLHEYVLLWFLKRK